MEAKTSLRNRIQVRNQEWCPGGQGTRASQEGGTGQYCAVKGPGELEWHGVLETKTGFAGVSDQGGESSVSCLVGGQRHVAAETRLTRWCRRNGHGWEGTRGRQVCACFILNTGKTRAPFLKKKYIYIYYYY